MVKLSMAKQTFLKDYFSSLAYLSLLLGACLVLLPRSSTYFYASEPVQRSSTDRPEHPFLTPITANVPATLGWELVGLVITMAWWGGKVSRWWGGGERRIVEATYATLGTAVLLATALFLLGAPSSTWLRTPLFGLHLALLTAWPVAYTLGIPSIHDQGIAARARLTRLLCSWKAENARERILAFPIAGTLIGAWIGAVPIALDWDRPWQTYPLTPLVGSLVGFVAGGYYSFTKSALESLQQEIRDDAASTAAQNKPVVKKRKGGKAK